MPTMDYLCLIPHAYRGHRVYNDWVEELLDDAYSPSMSAEEAYDALISLADDLRNHIIYNRIQRLR